MAPWDILGKAADVAQLTGLDVIVLITFIVSYIRITHKNSDGCHKLDERVRKLRSLFQRPSSSELAVAGIPMRTLLEALDEAAILVDSYTKSSLWWRVLHGSGEARRASHWVQLHLQAPPLLHGRRLANQFRDMHSNIDSCIVVFFFNIHIDANPPRTSGDRIGVEHGGPNNSSIPTTTGPCRNEADQAGTSPDSHVINMDHETTYTRS